MPDRLHFCLGRYESIRSQPGFAKTDANAVELADWIERDVSPIVDELSQRNDFRELARWPIKRLLPGSQAPERRLVENVDSRLLEAAHALTMVAYAEPTTGRNVASRASASPRKKFATKRRAKQFSPIGLVGVESPESKPSAAHLEAPPTGPQLIALIASRPWKDLACYSDYFGPAAGLNLQDREAYLGPGASQVQFLNLTPYGNPRLRPLGDFISGMLLARAQHWRDVLQRFSVWRQSVVPANDREDDPRWSTVFRNMDLLEEDFERLRHALTIGQDVKLREACLVLMEAQAAFRPQTDFSWLREIAILAANAARFRYWIEYRHDFALVDQIAAALTEVAPLYRSAEDSEALLQQACARHDLVLVDGAGRREAYWKRQLFGISWLDHQAPWRLLLTLAERLVSGRAGTDGFQIDCSVKDARSRLKKMIPQELNEHIDAAGKGTYILNLNAEQVCLMRWCEDERLVRWPEFPGRSPFPN